MSLFFRFEDVEGLLANALDTRGEGKAQQMGQAEDGLAIAMGIEGPGSMS